MQKQDLLYNEIKSIPEYMLEEVIDFIRFLKLKERSEFNEMLIMSESALSKDWLNEEEDKAWKNL
ncbi:MAG: DUF2281 domain-containing protein [Candidatus Cloacimonetes bacterium]|nr:DUF2281 domain-containing protein [Candidatus Cloacimonadota bacterium]